MKGIFDQWFLVVDLLEMLGNGLKISSERVFLMVIYPWYKVKIHPKP